jgi:GTPase Era involved in 16S rRNA processing/gas vesicle protein
MFDGEKTKQSQNLDSEYFEQLQALTNCDEHLIFVENIVNNNLIRESDKKQIVNQINRIKSRSLDTNFYLAVVGEFSSGKSTFINALLRDEILKTSALVATATATKIKSGEDLTIEVQLNGEKKEVFKTNKTSSIISIPQLNIKDVTLRELIYLLTANDHVAQNVVDLTITHPAKFLEEGITIIDTPGTNAVNIQHGKVTRKTIENEADAVVIIIPATIPLSQSLANFLETALRPFLHRCVFVVTKIDSIRKKDRATLLNNLRQRLQEMLGIKNPILLSVSPQIILDNLSDDEITIEEITWISTFTHLESVLIKKLRRERIVIIAENLLRLLTQILEQLAVNLTEEWQQYQERQIALKNETIQDLSYFTLEQKTKCNKKMDNTINSIKNQINYYISEEQEKNKQAIRQKIMAVNDWDGLKSVTESGAESVLKSSQEEFKKKLELEFKVMDKFAQLTQQDFDKEFSKAYEKLQALGASFNVTQNSNNQDSSVNISNVFSDMKALQAKQEDDASNRVIQGAVIGVIGAILLPGIGAFIGGIAGAYLSRLFGPSLEERKNELWFQLEPSLNSYFQQTSNQLQEEILKYGRQLNNFLETHINSYMGKYKEAVDMMLNNQQLELNRLTILQQSSQDYLKEIERRKTNIKQQQERLVNSQGG